MLVKNGKVYRNRKFEYQDLRIEDGRIVEFLPTCSKEQPGEEVLDVYGAYVLPGFIDLQVHGAAGRDFSDASEESLADISHYLLMHGVTSYLAALDSFPKKYMEEACELAADWIDQEKGSAVLRGINLTGPFIAENRKGMQDERYLQKPDLELLQHLDELSGNGIRIVNLSPELEGAKEFVQGASKKHMISLTHSDADFRTARMCYAYGAEMLGDLYQEMPSCSWEDPGLLGASVDACRYVTFCPDPERLHSVSYRMAYQLFHQKRICLTGNTSAFAGLKNDTYYIENHKVTVKGGSARFEDGSFAGGVRCLDEILHLNTDMGGIPLAMSVDSCTETPAKALGIFDEVGSIDIGKRADLTVLDLHNLSVKHVVLGGKKVF